MSELPATHLPEHPPKRGRGRPPKMKAKAVSEDGGAAGVGAVLGKRGRGRPPKAWKGPVESLDDGARRPEVVPPVVMKIGRQKGPPPRKVVVKRKRKESEEEGGGGGGRRPRGRPRKEPDAPVGPLVVVPPVVMTIGRQKGPPRTPKKKSKRPRGRPLKPGGRKVVERSGRPVGRPRKAKPGPESQVDPQLARPPDPEPEAEAQVVERPRRPRGRPRKLQLQLQLPVAAPPPEPEPVPEEGVAQGQEATI